jgi:putative membrane-bound dehydrogenase-like protein
LVGGWLAAADQPAPMRNTPLPPDQAQALFKVAPGLRVELAAAEPQVESPVAAAFDEDGRLWVVEMLDYPNGPAPGQPPEGRVKVLEDRDGDGRFETARVFADKLLYANGLMPWKGGVIVTAAPHVLELRDADGDGRADERTVLYEGFATANPQLRVSFPVLGPDNWVYVANGLRGGQIRPAGSKGAPAVSISGMDFRFDLLSGRHEAVSGMGQYGNTFDDWGNRFVCDNRRHVRHVVLPNRYLKRNPHLAVTQVLEDTYGPTENADGGGLRVFPLSRNWTTSNLHASQFTAACGVYVYRDGLLPAPYRGAVFTCEPTGNLVHGETLRAHRATFRSAPLREGVEFLASPDDWFRPVSLASGPDGALYVVDMARAVIEHPEWVPAELKNRPDLLWGKHAGRIWRIVPEGHTTKAVRPNLGKATTAELVNHLDHADAWWRTTAQQLLLERQDPAAVDPLRRLCFAARQPAARVLAAGLLDQRGALGEADAVRLLRDEHPRVREIAVALAERWLPTSAEVQSRLTALARDPDARLRFQVALSLGEWDDDRILDPLASIALAGAGDRWTRAAVASAVPTRAGKLLARLIGAADSPAGLRPLWADLAGVVGARQDRAEITACLAALARQPGELHRDVVLDVLAALADGLARRGQSLGKFVESLAPDQRNLGEWVTGQFRTSGAIAADASRPVTARVAAVRMLASAPWEVAGPVLTNVLADEADQSLRLAAARAIAGHPTSVAAAALLGPWRGYTPAVRKEVAELLARQPDRAKLLLVAVERGEVKPADLDPAVTRRLTGHGRPDIRDLARRVLADAVPADRKQVLDQYQAALTVDGDAKRGRDVFAKNCATCHRVAGHGVTVGPDVSDTRTKTPAMLLNDILNPNAAVDGTSVEYVVTLKNGKQVSGIIAGEAAAGITLRRAEGQADTVLRQDVEAIESTGRSLMPDGLEKTMTVAEVADLIAFLKNWRYLDGSVPLGPPK